MKINVKELPPNAPKEFNGAVGKLNCEISVDKSVTKANEAVNIKVKISGKGNIKLIESPEFTFPPDFETYDPKENTTLNASAAGVTGTKTFEYLIIPRNPGDFKITVNPFVYFDLDRKQYTKIDLKDLTLKVTKGDGNSITIASDVQRSDVKQLGKDIHFIKTNDIEFDNSNKPLFGSIKFYSFMLFPALAFFLLLFVRKKNKKDAGNSDLLKSQRANRAAMKRLSAAKKYLSTNEKDKFLDEMFRALWGFIADKLVIPVADLSKEKVVELLTEKNISNELINEFSETIDSCEFARFAGGIADSNDIIYQKGITIISKLESVIR